MTCTDPWTIGAGYSVKPVARAIKIKHAGFNPMVLGSVVVSNGVGMSSRRNPLATRQLIPGPVQVNSSRPAGPGISLIPYNGPDDEKEDSGLLVVERILWINKKF